MVICFPGVYIELYIIYTVQTVICIELYTYNPHTQLYTYNYTLYVIRKLCDVIIQKKLKFVVVKLSFNAYNGLKHQIMHHIIITHTVMHI